MSTAPVSSGSIYQELQTYFQQRTSDVNQLGQDLTSGNVANAQQDFATLQSLGQGGPFANGDPFAPGNAREQDFAAIGQAFQSGNLSAAQQAFAQLQSTFKNGGGGGSDSIAAAVSAAASALTQSSAPTQTSAPPANSIYQQLREYYQQRKADVGQLSQDLASGNTANAQQDVAALQALGQSGPFKSGDPFVNRQRESDFAAIGQALQSGDLAGAQQAFAQLEGTFHNHHQTSPPVYQSPQATNAVPISGLDTTA
jgi:spermidine/putrescine-binding protein